MPLPTLDDSPASARHASRRARQLRRDLRLLVTFVSIRCRHCHPHAEKHAVSLKTHDVDALARRPVCLCGDCRKLLAHALVKRTHCPYDPKPMCKKCPTHCYAPQHREAMREVMRYSGRKLVMSGRIDYLLHLLF
ncbi:MAG TPA: nitrous oxide-stimulated promoter family protein [Phycisphaerae bacterium]|nr:nitrous oxide-stimulated promoter family protein [Phycisphaerae bacterium]